MKQMLQQITREVKSIILVSSKKFPICQRIWEISKQMSSTEQMQHYKPIMKKSRENTLRDTEKWWQLILLL
jgi:hypothetical protein